MLKSIIKRDPVARLFKKEISSLKYLKKNDKIVVAVSGGIDSIALLYLLHSLDMFKIIVAHIDHSIRKDSIKDRLFVEDISKNLSLQFFFKKLNFNSKQKRKSLEEWAREERYKYFKDLCKKTKSKWAMTGHHCNDHAETILFNLSRQTGISGMLGIPKENGMIIRPLLSFNKKEIFEFVDRNGIPFVEDSTNLDFSIPRNFIRKELIKPWESKVSSLIKNIYHSSLHLKEWKSSLDQLLRIFVINNLKINDKKIEIPIRLISGLPNLCKIRLIQLLFQKEKCLWSKHDLKMLEQFFNKASTGKIFDFLAPWSLLYDRKVIIAVKNNEIDFKQKIKIKPDKVIFFNKKRYKIITGKVMFSFTKSQNEEIIDWAKFKDKMLEIRVWKKGDVFQPLGMKNIKKVSDFLINEKIDNFSKKHQSVLTVDGKIAWVCGLRISDWVKVTEKTKEKAKLTFKDY